LLLATEFKIDCGLTGDCGGLDGIEFELAANKKKIETD
jgi:hypothetical protein